MTKKRTENIDWDIILRKIKGNISVQEEEALDKWLNASPVHQKYYKETVKYYKRDISGFDLELVPADTQKFLNKLHQKSRIVRFRKIMRYAAVILPVFVVLSMWFFKNNFFRGELTGDRSIAVIEPVSNKARLITSTGESIVLGENAAAVIVDASGVTINNYSLAGLQYKENIVSAGRKEVFNTLVTPRGGEYKLKLADGTKVWLNCESELRYPVSFTGKVRKVILTGEAYFDVSKSGKPFIVETAEMSMQVLGTKFNISAYQDDREVQTTLVEGSLKVTTKDRNRPVQSITLIPGRQANFNKELGYLENREVDTNLYTSWIDGYFQFKAQTLDVIMKNISRWYDIEVRFENQQIKEKQLTGRLYRFDDFTVITGMIEKISGVKIEVANKKITISK